MKMNNELQLFDFENNQIRVLKINNEPWFVGKDVATILGYSNTRKALIDHVDDEDKKDGVTIRDSMGRSQLAVVINESGMYSLILSSKLPNAKKFKRWVTSEVLPAIREDGAYITDNKAMQLMSDPQELGNFLLTIGNRVKALEAEKKELKDTNAKQAAKIARDADDVVFAKAIRYSHHAIPVGELAEILTQNGFVIGRNQLFQLLREEKYLSSFNHSWNVPMTQMVKRGLFRITHNLTRDGRGYSQTWVTPKGQKHIINKALRGKFDDTYQKVMVSTLNV
ncbi:MAG: phage antirepressor [Lactobacillus johnsonii]|nr:phage antirepressor [Limosilactobacillus reuteri]MDY4501349.1 phage antirepressor [Lactobacillus johnsonii]MDY5351899.1 phage antirepressor [Lactobacillus johnsonii]MDY5610728.1 phage antirepressor [Lactobacillus johnsonii]MDY6042084.1 phage antirepressor [Lactobacillus johnsonii]